MRARQHTRRPAHVGEPPKPRDHRQLCEKIASKFCDGGMGPHSRAALETALANLILAERARHDGDEMMRRFRDAYEAQFPEGEKPST